jgi:hypothetical protein
MSFPPPPKHTHTRTISGAEENCITADSSPEAALETAEAAAFLMCWCPTINAMQLLRSSNLRGSGGVLCLHHHRQHSCMLHANGGEVGREEQRSNYS